MPARVVVWIIAALIVIAAGFVLLRPADDAVTAGDDGSPPVVTANPAPAGIVGGDAVDGAAEPAVAAAVPADLVDDLQAFAASRTPVIPPADGLGTLVAVTPEQGTVTFVFEVAIDGATYELQGERIVLTRGLAAVDCDDGTCFEVQPSIVDDACSDEELAALLRRGAKATYFYRDVTRRELATMSISAANCPA